MKNISVLLIIILVIGLITYIIYNNFVICESFSGTINYTSTDLIYTSCISNSSWIINNFNTNTQLVYQDIPNYITWNTIKSIINENNSINLINNNISYHTLDGSPAKYDIGNIGIIVDSFELSQINTQLKYKKFIAPKGYFIAFTTPQKAMDLTCSIDISGRNVGYFGYTDEVFIDSIIYGHRIDKYSVKKTLIPQQNIPILNGYMNDIDIFITYIIPGSDFHKTLLKQRITFMGFSDMDIARVQLFYPGITMTNNINITNTFLDLPPPNDVSNNTATVTKKENITNLPSITLTMLLFTPTKIENFTNNDSQLKPETFITRLELPDTYLDPTYSCYGDITENIKALCDSPYDIYGQPKTRTTTWDHPCIVDSDCPYFKANTNYSNTRGGCMDSGVCELPIGVKRVSYRKFEDKDIYAPFCYGCDAYDTECCSKQKQPDYAFVNDTNDRINANLDLKTTLQFN
jgi:hypothetical protein